MKTMFSDYAQHCCGHLTCEAVYNSAGVWACNVDRNLQVLVRCISLSNPEPLSGWTKTNFSKKRTVDILDELLHSGSNGAFLQLGTDIWLDAKVPQLGHRDEHLVQHGLSQHKCLVAIPSCTATKSSDCHFRRKQSWRAGVGQASIQVGEGVRDF